jgi:hypothetical protein
MAAMVDDGDDDDEETARYYLVGPDGNDGDGLWRGVLLVIGSWFNNQLVVFIIYRYPV